MTSTVTAFTPIPERSDATPGLFNVRFQQLQDNQSAAVADLVGWNKGSVSTTVDFSNGTLSTNTIRAASGNTIRLPNGHEMVLRSLDSGGGFYNLRAFAVGDGVADDAASLRTADAQAAASGGVLLAGPGTYKIGSAVTFASPVVLSGGSFTGVGRLAFTKGVSGPQYYAFDCAVTNLNGSPQIEAEWFGARRSPATLLSADVTSKSWNTWPSWVTGGGFAGDPGHAYGDATYLGANLPYVAGDTWDFVATQRALWAVGDINLNAPGGRGLVRLSAGSYYWNKPVQWTNDMSATLAGAGFQQTLISSNNWTSHSSISNGGGPFTNVNTLAQFYSAGGVTTYLRDLALVGPVTMPPYSVADPRVALVVLNRANGVVLDSLWLTNADYGVMALNSSNDNLLTNTEIEFCATGCYGYDVASWIKIADCAFWQSSTVASKGLDWAGYSFVDGLLLSGFSGEPFSTGTGSVSDGVQFIHHTTGYRSHLGNRRVKHHLSVKAGTTVNVVTVGMGANTAIRTQMTGGGVVFGVGAAGIQRTITWYRESGAPVAAGSSATTWGTPSAASWLQEAVATSGGAFTIQIKNLASLSTQTYDCDVTLDIEGSDHTLSGLI